MTTHRPGHLARHPRGCILLLAALVAALPLSSASQSTQQGAPGGNRPASVFEDLLRAPILASHPAATQQASVTLSGSAVGANEVEVVAPAPPWIQLVPVSGGVFSALVPLALDQPNTITLRSKVANGFLSAPTTTVVVQDGQAPQLLVDYPLDGSTSSTQTLTVVGRAIDSLSGIASVTVDGTPAVLVPKGGGLFDFSLSGFTLAGGPQSLQIVATDGAGSTTTSMVSVTYTAPPPAWALVLESGGSQQGPINLQLAQPLVVEATQGNGTPFVGKVVTFAVEQGGGTLSVQSGGPRSPIVAVATDANGQAAVWWTLGPVVGTANNRVRASSLGLSGEPVFQSSASSGFSNEVHVISGDDQSAQVGSVAPLPLRVRVKNGEAPVQQELVTFTVIAGGGAIGGLPSVAKPTDSGGYAEIAFTLGAVPGPHVVDATIANASSPAVFSLVGIKGSPQKPTSLSGLVLDHADDPLQGVTCEVLEPDGSVAATAATDALGRFELPTLGVSGAVTLRAKGSTATAVAGSPLIGTYADLEVPLVLVPTAHTVLPRPVALSLRMPGNVRTFDGTADVTLTLPEVEGFALTVHAGSSSGAALPIQVRVDQIHHDKLPFPLPDGSEPVFGFLFDAQGATFDPPVSLELPNVLGLPPGTPVGLWVFDPSTGTTEALQGTVSFDASKIHTGAGSGIKQGGFGAGGGGFGESLTYTAPDPCAGAPPAALQTAFLPLAGGVIRNDACGSGAFGALHGGVPNPGVDIEAPGAQVGDPVVTVYDGTVFAIQEGCFEDPLCAPTSEACGSGYGNFVVVEHPIVPPNGEFVRLYTAYCNLEMVTVNVGDALLAGDTVGGLGRTGNANPACLPCAPDLYVHFELSANVPPLAADVPRCDPGLYLTSLLPPSSTAASPAFASFQGQSVLQASGEVGFGTAAELVRVNNVAAPTLGKGTLRSSWIVGDTLRELNSPFADLVQGGVVPTNDVDPDADGGPTSVSASIASSVLTSLLQTEPLTVTAFDESNTPRDVTSPSEGTFYRTSNPGIVTVGTDGLVTAQGFGTAYVTAVNEGTLSTVEVSVTAASPLTTVQGFVLTPAPGSVPHQGALVTVYPGNLTGTTDAQGFFQIPNVPALEGDLTLFADAMIGGAPKTVTVAGIVPVPGLTDAGILVLENAVYWTSNLNGSWSAGSNWSTSSPPSPGANVVIDRPGSSPTVTIDVQVAIKSLRCKESLILNPGGGSLSFAVQMPYQVDASFTLEQGTLAASVLLPGTGGASVSVPDSKTVRLDFMTVAADVEVDRNSVLEIRNGLTLDGTITRPAPGGSAQESILRFVGTQVLAGRGGLDFTTADGGFRIEKQDAGGMVTIGEDIAIVGHGDVTNFTSGAVFVNQGTMRAAGGTLDIRPTTWVNQGSLEALGGATLQLDGNWSNLGSLSGASGSTVRLQGTFKLGSIGKTNFAPGTSVLTAGTLDLQKGTLLIGEDGETWTMLGTIKDGRIESAGTVLQCSGSPRLDEVELAADTHLDNSEDLIVVNGLTLDGAEISLLSSTVLTQLLFEGAQTLAGTGTITMGGVQGLTVVSNSVSGLWTIGPGITITGTGTVGTTLPVINEGLIHADTGQSIRLQGPTFSNAPAGRLVAEGTIDIEPGFVTSGSVSLPGGSVDFGSGNNYVQTGGTTTLSGGTLAGQGGGSSVEIQGGVLQGTGMIDGSGTGGLTLSGTATLRPGGLGASGTITILGGSDYTQTANAVLEIELGGLTAGSGYDRLVVGDDASLAGTLQVTLIGGFAPVSGNTFDVVTYGSRTGTLVPVLPPGSWQVDYLANGVRLTYN